MKILIAGASGYIGRRLMLLLCEEGHEIYAIARDPSRIEFPEQFKDKIHLIKADLLDFSSLTSFPKEIDAAYFLVHSMRDSKDFENLEAKTALDFREALERTNAKQIIYLSGIANEQKLSKHLASRKKVGEILGSGKIPLTQIRAGVIVGSGSASFEIIRDLVEKLPFMITPRWLKKKTQPISIRDTLFYLSHVLGNEKCLGRTFEIGGPDILTYEDLLRRFAKVRGFTRRIITIPVLTPRLSSYWLYFVTSTSFSLAKYLVDSLINNAVCKENEIQKILPRKLLNYEEAVKLALAQVEEDWVPSSWRDDAEASGISSELSHHIEVPHFGVLVDRKKISFEGSIEKVKERIWSLGGSNGWPSMNWAWAIRGLIDELLGGIGVRRGRRHPSKLTAGDALDFWRVILSDREKGHLLLYAEMILPGEAWLEFKIHSHNGENYLEQIATFRPKGVFGRFYWYLLFPIHTILFRRMAKRIAYG